MNIRPMRKGDLESVSRLCLQLGYPCDIETLNTRYEKLLLEDNNALFVAENGHIILGWIYVGSVVPLTSEPRAQIWGLVVDENFRGKGVGKQLVQKGEVWAKEALNVKLIGVGSNENRKESHRFYKKLNYPEKKRWVVYQKSLF